MARATDFTRDDCRLGRHRVTYQALLGNYRCNECAGRLVQKWSEERGWHVTCGRCGSMDFVHEYSVQRQEHEALEVVDGLPPELAALVRRKEGERC